MVQAFVQQLIRQISGCSQVLGIGQTGDPAAPLIPGKSDIDLFVICSTVPDRQQRLALYSPLEGSYDRLDMEVCSGGIWGYGDIFIREGIDVMPMYFTAEEMLSYVQQVLAGQHLEKEGRFYPIGRLASIETLHVLHERGSSWTDIIDLVKTKPEPLFTRWYENEISRVLDEEDLGRA